MTVRTLESTANCNVEEAQEWLTNSLNDALLVPGNREAQITITYLEEDGRVNIVTGQMDSDDRSWDCKSVSHQLNVEPDDPEIVPWGLKTYNTLADQFTQLLDDIVPVSERASEHDEPIRSACQIDDDED